MNWEIVSAMGELVGGLAVLVTIIYLAIQIRQAKITVRSQIRQQAAAQSMALTESVYNSDHMPTILRKVREGEELLPDERVRLYSYLSSFHRHFESMRYLAEVGDLSEDVFEGNNFAFGEGGWVNSRYGRDHWELTRSSYPVEYRNWVDKILKDRKGT